MITLKKFPTFLVLAVIVFGSFASIGQLVARAQGTTCAEYPQLVLSEQVQVSAEHAVWVLAKKETATAKPYVQVNEGTCQELKLPSGAEWEWVSGKNGTINEQLPADLNFFNFSVVGGSVLMDKVLVTNDLSCTPTGDGSNCLIETLDFSIEGIQNNETVSEPRNVRAVVAGTIPDAMIEFAIDGEVVSTQNSAPYCLQAGPTDCTAYDFVSNGLSNGAHVLTVRGVTNENTEVVKTINFTIAGSPVPPAVPTPTPPTNPPATPPTVPTTPAPTPASTVVLSGLRNADVVSGDITVEASVNGSVSEVEFYVNDKPYSKDSTAPYCMVSSGSGCSTFDTKSLTNGVYRISTVAKLADGKTLGSSVSFTISNAAPKPTEAPKKQEVVIGVPKQQATGIITATVPKARTTNATTVTYTVNDTPVATVPASKPATTIDTSKYTNGPSTITATIQKNNGETEVLKSNVQVKNDTLTSSSNWFKENIVLTVGLLLFLTVGLFFLIRIGVERYRLYQMTRQHNLADTYAFVQPQEQAAFQTQAYGGMAALLIMTVGVVSLTRFGSSAVATGLGFVKEIEETAQTLPAQYSLVTQTTNTEVYVRLNYELPAAPNPTTPPPPASDANILYETFEGRGQGVSNGTIIDGSNTFAKLNYGGIPVAGYCIYDLSPCYSVPDNRVLPAFDSAVKFSGQYSARFSILSVGRDTQAGSFYHQSFDRTNSAYARFWWRFDQNMANAGGNPSLIHWRGDYGLGPQYADVRLGGGRTLNLSNHNGSGGVDGNYQYSADTWYDVSLELQGPSGMSRLVVRDQQGNQLQDTTHYYEAGGNIGFMEFGVLGGYSQNYSNLASMWFDDVRMSTSALGDTGSAPAPNPPAPNPPAPTPPAPTPPTPPAPPAGGSTFFDNFDDGSANMTGPTGSGPHGHINSLVYMNGAVYPAFSSGESILSANGTFGRNQYAQADLITDGDIGSDYAGITVRSTINPEYSWYKFEMTAGGSMRIASLFYQTDQSRYWYGTCGANYTMSPNSRKQIKLEIRDYTLIGYVDGVAVAHCVDNTPYRVTRDGQPGIIMEFGPSIDNFEAGTITNAAPGNLPGQQQLIVN